MRDEWEEVTADCVWEDEALAHHLDEHCIDVTERNGYRVRKVELSRVESEEWTVSAFIVERKRKECA